MKQRKPYHEPTEGWNFRVVRHVQSDGSLYWAIHEAYYSATGISITEKPVTVGSDDDAGILWQLEHMQVALNKPIIAYETRQRISDRAAVFAMKRPSALGSGVGRPGLANELERKSPE